MALVVWADFLSLLGAGVYLTADQGTSAGAYVDQTIRYLDVGDVIAGVRRDCERLGRTVIDAHCA